MQGELLQRLDALSVKLGVGAEHMWEVLMKQVYVEVGMWLLFGLSIAFCSFCLWKVQERMKREDDCFDLCEVPQLCIPWILLSGCALAFVIAAFVEIVPRLLNPEYFALKAILHAIGG